MESKKPIFKFEDYPEKDVAMHCKTEKEANYFCSFLHHAGRKWQSDASYLEYTFFDNYKEDTVYRFNIGTYRNVESATEDGVGILEFSDFEWPGFKSTEGPVLQESVSLISPFESAINDMLMYCKGLLFEKNKGYNTDADPTGNFKRAAALQGISDKQALIGMMDKHVVSIHDMVNKTAKGEKFTDEVWKEKIGDNINYLLILYAMTKMEG